MPLHLDYGDTTVLDLWEPSARRHPDRVSSHAEIVEEVRLVA